MPSQNNKFQIVWQGEKRHSAGNDQTAPVEKGDNKGDYRW